MGGRGATTNGIGSNLFKDRGERDKDNSFSDFPSRVNKMYEGNKRSFENTLSEFRKSFDTDTMEHAFVIDDMGFVTTFRHGNKGSVSVSIDAVKSKTMIHNHPSKSHFSKTDLDSFSNTKMKGLVASSPNGAYHIQKTQNFDSKGFQNALSNYKTTKPIKTMEDYNHEVDKFLKKNAKKYGYKYQFIK